MTRKEILDYVMNSPGNTNPSVLKGMLNSVTDGGESGAGVFMVEVGLKEDGSLTRELKATWQEIYDALKAGKLVVVPPADDETVVYNSVTLVLTANYDGDTYQVAGITYTNDIAPDVYTCSTPDERPYVGSGQNPGDES